MIDFTRRASRNEAQFERRLGTQIKDDRNPKQKYIGQIGPLAPAIGPLAPDGKRKKTSRPHLAFKKWQRAPQIKQNDPCAEKNQLYHTMKHSF